MPAVVWPQTCDCPSLGDGPASLLCAYREVHLTKGLTIALGLAATRLGVRTGYTVGRL